MVKGVLFVPIIFIIFGIGVALLFIDTPMVLMARIGGILYLIIGVVYSKSVVDYSRAKRALLKEAL